MTLGEVDKRSTTDTHFKKPYVQCKIGKETQENWTEDGFGQKVTAIFLSRCNAMGYCCSIL